MLVGVIHLPPLPGSPRASATAAECARSAATCARTLASAGYDAIIVENFGDAPFFGTRVPPITVAAMTRSALAVREAAPSIRLGINVLRNDAEAALSIAAVTGASFVRINIHTGARVTDQGVIEGTAASTLRFRRALDAPIDIWADVDVKHSVPVGTPAPIEQEVEDTTKRGLADVVLVTGDGTGKTVDLDHLSRVKRAAGDRTPILVASGATIDALAALRAHADGVVVGSALRKGGIAGGPVDETRARTFAEAFRKAFS